MVVITLIRMDALSEVVILTINIRKKDERIIVTDVTLPCSNAHFVGV